MPILLICNNALENLFDEQFRTDIAEHVVWGSADIFNARSRASTVWQQIELMDEEAGDWEEARSANQDALENLQNARQRYEGILETVEEVGISDQAEEDLRNFDYTELGMSNRFPTLTGIEGREWDRFVRAARQGNVDIVLGDITGKLNRLIENHEKIDRYLSDNRSPPEKFYSDIMNDYQALQSVGFQSSQVFKNVNV